MKLMLRPFKSHRREQRFQRHCCPNPTFSTQRRKDAKTPGIKFFFAPLHLCVFALIFACCSLSAADPISDALQKGLFEEEANHNLDAAIKAYQSVIDQTAEQRKLTATAVFRLGECYRKLNKTNEAIGQYQRVVREFSDVTPLVTISQQNLVGLGVNTSQDTRTAAATSEEAEEIAKIKAMIKYSPDLINAPHQSGLTPLGTAAQKGYLAVAKFLLDNKAELEVKGNGGSTALHLAVEGGHKTMVELLLDRGADVKAVDGSRKQPLHLAVSKGYRSIIELLLSRKADINAKDSRGRTPLHMAINGDGSIAKFVLDRGADVNAQDDQGWTALHYAISSVRWTGAILNYKPNLELVDNEGLTPLVAAAGSRGNVLSLELLLKAGADVNKAASKGLTPLMAAITRPDADKVRLLLDHKANPNEKWHSANSPLEWVLGRLRYTGLTTAEKTNLTEIADLLRQNGATQVTANLPSIGITRNGKELNFNYLKQDPQGLNRFTLFELLLYLYDSRGPQEGTSISMPPKFPDFANIQITHPEPHGGKRISKLNLEEALLSGDCSKDVLLEWGDIVDIPEKDHKLSESWTELPREITQTLYKCLERRVNITIKGETTSLLLRPKFWPYHVGRQATYNSSDALPFLRLENVLQASKLLRASSDRTRVQVTRKVVGQQRTFVFNLEAPNAARPQPLLPQDGEEDLLLQNGDTIFVPDKT